MHLIGSPSFRAALRTRFRPLWWFVACFLGISLVTRIILLVKTGSGVPAGVDTWAYVFGVGLAYDLVTCIYVAWPLVLLLWLTPTGPAAGSGLVRWLRYAAILVALCGLTLLALHLRFHAGFKTTWPVLLVGVLLLPLVSFNYTSRTGQWVLYGLALVLVYGLLFVGAAEWTFWNEFGTRFNFIAVDYLVYTREVVGNIEESYPIGRWLAELAVVAVVLVLAGRRMLRTREDQSSFGARSVLVLAWLVATVLVTVAVSASMKDRTRNTYVNALSGNGIYQFFAAFRANRLDYPQFYRTLPQDQAFGIVRRMLQTPDATYVSDDPHDLTRLIRNPGPERHMNVVLISVESLSGDYLGVFGNHQNLTPNLDRLAGESWFFTRLFANGTRTVRGLEALSLSVPPTPGDSLIKQKHNDGLFSLADIFNEKGYVSEFVYGGYGYFDNMNQFFSSNGYRAVDRDAIPPGSTIHSENVWGVADEDLYTLAMGEMDRIHAQGKPFFLHLMTTSNHRPYTFPEGRVKGRQGEHNAAVRYTDWAIGDFIARMRKKPYFDNTVFVITADHCASSAGKSSIPVNHYHIPLIVYAPARLQPRRIDRMMGQLDIAPTLLGMLHFSYRSRFFGYDIMQLPAGRGRAFPSTYQKLGYLRGDTLTILAPQRRADQVHPDFDTGDATPLKQADPGELDQAIASYQVAAYSFRKGLMKRRAADATPVQPLPAQASSTAPPASVAAGP